MKTGGLMIELKKDEPAILIVGDKVIELYQNTTKNGQRRIRVVADSSVIIKTPQRVKKENEGRWKEIP